MTLRYLLFCTNIVVFSGATHILYGQLLNFYRFLKRKSIKEVVLSNVSSGCCNEKNFSKPNGCPNQYCVRKIIGRIIQLIDSSQHSICLAMYGFHCYELHLALKQAHQRRVKVKILTTNESMKSLNMDLMDLIEAGVAVRFPQYGLDKLLHHKFCLVDTEKQNDRPLDTSVLPEEGVVLTGSMNWTMSGFCTNWDNFVITSNQDIVQSYQKEFNSMWKRLNT